MEEVGLSVVAKLVEYLVDPTLHQLQYLFCFGKITRNVETRKKELIFKQGRVQEHVEEAINKTERIDDEVKNWKNEVENLIAEVENLEQELRANNGCFRRWCPTWKRYCLCKNLAERTQRMIELNTKSDQFNPFSHPVTVPDIEYHSSKNFVIFKSTKMASDQLWEAFQDDGSFIIGLFGMGGSGKTTLVKEVGKKAKESKLFDRVVFTTVSQTPNIRKIQGEVADLLGLKLDEESEIGRARRIALRLQSPDERILMILDDVWAKLNLEDIGNPFRGNHQTSCKVLLTTRRQEVCTLMDCQKTIPMHLLTEDEAWTLFQTHANVDDGATEAVAREVAEECKGLPIAIVAMGTCLKGKGLDEMNVVLYRLRQSKPIHLDRGVRDAFVCLELSYDYLRTQEAKLLFLMCAMFPEDHEINIQDILMYGVGLGLYRDVDSFEIARSQVGAAINILIDSSLLMYSENIFRQECLRMHDMVRDVALWIASKEDRTIIVNHTKELNELFDDESVKDCYAVSSWYNNKELHQFPCQLDAPKLEILLLNSGNPLDLSHASFEGIKGLKVMAMIKRVGSNSMMGPLPQSIRWLSNLRTLQLRGWNLGDICSLISLTRLEILDLQCSKFKKLPNGIERLNKLKLLDLSWCKMDECCYKAIGSCSQLEELYICRDFQPMGNMNCYECLVGVAALPKLRRYIIEMGHYSSFKIWRECTRVLYLGELNISISSGIIKDLAQRAVAIGFDKLQGGCKSFIPDMVQAIGGMNELTKLRLDCCSEIECLTDKTTPHEDAIVPSLVVLQLESMDNLKQLCRGPPLLSLFQNLESVNIVNCPQLHGMFPTDCNLGNLKFLTILDCPMLTSLFPVSVACTALSLKQLRIGTCRELKHVIVGEGGADAWEDLKFPEWEILTISNCYQLESICPIFCVQGFVQLQYLSIKNAPELKFVFGEHVGEERSIHDQNETQIVLPLLKDLTLENLPNLLRISSESYHPRWPSLKSVRWENCPKLSTSCDSLMIGSELRQSHPNMELHTLNGHQLSNEESRPLVAVSNIESIRLYGCGVAYIFHYQTEVDVQKPTISNGFNLIIQIPRLQYLKDLSLNHCAKLKFVFSAGICQNLPELTSVDIRNCEELEEIFVEDEEIQKNLSIAQTCLPKLRSLSIERCNKLRIIFSMMITVATSMLPQLSTLSISYATQLEEIFRCTNIEDHVTHSKKEIMFPNLKSITLMKLPRLVNVCQGFLLRIVEFCRVYVHECPKFVPILEASANWSPEGLVRHFMMKCSQLSNNEALTLPPSILNSEELDIQSSRVKDTLRVISDNDQQKAKDLEMLGSEHQILKGLIPTQVLSFQYLHSLGVIRCEKLKFLFSMSTIIHNNLPKLTFLTLSGCEELEEIIADHEEPQNISNAQVCFPELRELVVTRCNKLKRLFSNTMATMFPQLTSLVINEAAQLEEIFEHKSEDDPNNNGEKIVLPNLREIKLRNLPNLINVCQGLKLQAVMLGKIIIWKCPKFLDPILGSTQMISLQQWRTMVATAAHVGKELPLNKEQGMIMISRVEWLSLKHSPNLITVWEGPTFISFQNLGWLKVFGCRKLKFIFSGTVIRSLPCLKFLHIEKCEELEKIISERQEEEHHFPNPSSNSLCFPELAKLIIRRCSKLKCLFFSLPSNGDLARLQYLEITGCSQLEQVFSCELEIHKGGSKKNVLLTLQQLILEGLPNLTDICGGFPFQLQFHSLLFFKVEDCPIFSKTTLAALNNFLPRQRGRNPDDNQESEETYDDNDSVDSDDVVAVGFRRISDPFDDDDDESEE